MIGRSLEPGEVVHHINGDSSDDRVENLQLFASNTEHMRYGHGEQSPKPCGHCGELANPRPLGRCQPCYDYWRRHGRDAERPLRAMCVDGNRLRQLRKARSLTLEQLAVLAGTTSRTIGRIERGQGQPQDATMAALAESLGVSARTFDKSASSS